MQDTGVHIDKPRANSSCAANHEIIECGLIRPDHLSYLRETSKSFCSIFTSLRRGYSWIMYKMIEIKCQVPKQERRLLPARDGICRNTQW